MVGLVAKQAAIARERTLELEYHFRRLGICSKAYHEASEIQMNRNRTIIRAATLENKQLHSALNTLLEAERCSFGKSDMQRMYERVKYLRKSFDDQKRVVLQKLFQLDKACTDAQSAELDLGGIASDRKPIERLTEAVKRIKNKTKVGRSLRKSHENTLEPMRLERSAFESQMATFENNLKAKEIHLAKLVLLYGDAERARNAAKLQLDEMLEGYSARGPDEKKTSDSKEERIGMDVEIATITRTFSMPSMREMFLELIEQAKKSQYYQKIFEELVQLELKKGLTPEQKMRLRRNIPGFHILHELLGDAKEKTLYAGTLMTTIQGTKDVIHQLEKKENLKMTRHSGNLISMLTGTKKLVDKIHEGELYCSEDKSTKKLLQKCKRALVVLLQDVNKKVQIAKLSKEMEETTKNSQQASQMPMQNNSNIVEEGWVAVRHATFQDS